MKNKFKGYEDVERKIILLKDIADIEPYEIILPEPLKPEKIKGFGKPKEEQFYERENVPRKIWDITNSLNSKSITKEDALNAVKKDRELISFIETQWEKRQNGEWCYIYGKPIYITGTHWMYLNYYRMDVGLPNWRETDWRKYLWWKFCVEDNDSVYGGIDFDRRRIGKSYTAGNILLEYITRSVISNCGIQSKTEPDAKKFFSKSVLFPYRRYPFFFKPNGTVSTGEIKFEHESVHESFDSLIDFRSSAALAYDGQKVHRYLLDEAGKMEDPADPVNIWDKVKYCLVVDGQIIGKALITTTVEEMEKGGGEKFKFLFDGSSRKPTDIKSTGQTQTGLIPYFTSSYQNEVFDDYGYSVIETPTLHQQEQLKKRKDPQWMIGGRERVDKEISEVKNAVQRQNLIRKKPPTIRDAFRYNNTGCLYDIEVINNRLCKYAYGYPVDQPMTFGYFKWTKERFGNVEFVATDQNSELTRVHVRYLPPANLANASTYRNGKRGPANTARFNASADPFKLKTEQIKYKKDMSLGGAHVYALYDPMIDSPRKPREEWVTDNFCLEYLYRPETPDMFVEDMAMICIFYGCKIFPEPNIPIVDDLFREWGLSEYLQFAYKKVQRGQSVRFVEEKKMAGEYNTDFFRPTLIRHGINYIKEKGMYCPFPRTLEQLRDMSYENFNDFDLAVSALYCLTGVFDTPMMKKGEAKPKVTLDGLIPELRTY